MKRRENGRKQKTFEEGGRQKKNRSKREETIDSIVRIECFEICLPDRSIDL